MPPGRAARARRPHLRRKPGLPFPEPARHGGPAEPGRTGRPPGLTHQTGPADFERVTEAYRKSGFETAEVAPYYPKMADCFRRSDLVLCRAGATTCAELIASRKPSILVPFAGAAENHQEGNAREMEKAGGAEVILEKDLTPEFLARRILASSRTGKAGSDGAGLAALRTDGAADRIAGLCFRSWKERIRRRSMVKRGYRKLKHIHMVGIGGTGMNGIAEVLLNLGYTVSGSDIQENEATQRLARLGAVIAYGHRPENVGGADVVVISSAVRNDNVEVQRARATQIPVIPRAEMLAELMRMKYGIAVAGSHGKTSTTSMTALVLVAGGFDPTIIVGGRLNTIGANAKLGDGDFIVAEADESDRSFLYLSPFIAVLTNIDEEHLDQYQGVDDIKRTFVNFANKVPFYCPVILCLDDPNLQSIIPEIERKIITYGFSAQSDFLPPGTSLSTISEAPRSSFIRARRWAR